MSDLTLEPYAARLHFCIKAAMSKEQWQEVLSEYMEKLARRCEETSPCVIGHIKALSLFADGSYLRVSVVSSTLPAELDGNPPISFKELDVTLNVLVYGLSRDILQQIVEGTTSDLGPSFHGRVSVAPVGFHIIQKKYD